MANGGGVKSIHVFKNLLEQQTESVGIGPVFVSMWFKRRCVRGFFHRAGPSRCVRKPNVSAASLQWSPFPWEPPPPLRHRSLRYGPDDEGVVRPVSPISGDGFRQVGRWRGVPSVNFTTQGEHWFPWASEKVAVTQSREKSRFLFS